MAAAFWGAGSVMPWPGCWGCWVQPLILLAGLLAGITLFSGISWFTVIDFIGATGLAIFCFIRNNVHALIERMQERKAGEVAKLHRNESFEADKENRSA